MHAKHADVVALFAQRLDHVVLHLPLRLENVDAGRVLRRDEMLVNESEDAPFHRNRRCPPL
jgi:hypothetical protein